MEFRILKLYANINTFGELKMKCCSDNSTIEKEQLINVYDFILINYDNNCHTIVEPILKSQNYVYYGFIWFGMIVMRGYVNNKFKDNIYADSVSSFNMNFDSCNKISSFWKSHDFLQDKLPCFYYTKFTTDVEDLENYYKITKIDDTRLYYLERKGQLTKAAIK
ncbi:hypothetical protein Hokovirus_2_32 [Hokovirus HKV1]|uniref:Uncharacterized protein n=1 Tax=Hokovirus HKV1 TaxID=1977638 RepID=A0A1V0SFL1_9VIRU|nr:hypothetical protein Hokovirus_2_32 [Hokovirus HKV1]